MAIGTPTSIGSFTSGTQASSYPTMPTSVAVTAGNDALVALIYVGAGTGRNETLSGGGLTWTRLGEIKGAVNTEENHVALWRAPAPSGLASGTNLSVSLSGGDSYGMAAGMMQVSGLNTGVLDTSPVGAVRGTTTTSYSSGNLSVSAAEALLLTLALGDGNIDFTSTATGTVSNEMFDFEIGLNNIRAVVNYAIVSPGTYSGTGTWSSAPSLSDTAGLFAVKTSFVADTTNKPAKHGMFDPELVDTMWF